MFYPSHLSHSVMYLYLTSLLLLCSSVHNRVDSCEISFLYSLCLVSVIEQSSHSELYRILECPQMVMEIVSEIDFVRTGIEVLGVVEE